MDENVHKSLTPHFAKKAAEISLLCELRAADYPARKEAYHTLYAKVDELADWFISNSSPYWEPEAEIVAQAKHLTPIFMGGYYKSGTTFVRDLLDHHPQISVLPGDAKLLFNHRKYKQLPAQERLHIQQKSWIHRIINPTGLAPFWLFGLEPAPYIEFLQYFGYWFAQFDTPVMQDILAPALAYYCANPVRSEQARYWVNKTPMQELDINLLFDLFPQARFIHIIRNPLASLAARKKMAQQSNRRFNLLALLPEFKVSLSAGLQAKSRRKKQYFIIRYEDILADTVSQMTNLANWLNLSFHDSLLQPTVNGIANTPNSAYRNLRQQGKIMTGSQDRWRSVISNVEIQHTIDVLGNLANSYGYDWHEMTQSSASHKAVRQLARHIFYTIRQAYAKFR